MNSFETSADGHAFDGQPVDLRISEDDTYRSWAVEEWAAAIDALIASQRGPVFQIGDLLIHAEGKLNKTKFQAAIKQSGLKSMQNAQNYMRVSRNAFLRRPDIFERLPTTVGALIDLAAWPDHQIEEAIRRKVIHPQSERSTLRNWRRREIKPTHVQEEKPQTSVIVGYIRCDIATYDWDRAYLLGEQFDQMALKSLDGDMFITRSQHEHDSEYERLEMLATRVWNAYRQTPSLFVDPRFHKLINDRASSASGMQEDGGNLISAHVFKQAAPIIASADHADLHKLIRFSQSDWQFLQVHNVGHATLLSFFAD